MITYTQSYRCPRGCTRGTIKTGIIPKWLRCFCQHCGTRLNTQITERKT